MQPTILLIDDEPDVVALLKDYFELNGYLILTAYHGFEALKQAEKQPDAILLDVNMPGMDGLQVCRQIRNFVACPILFLTAKIEDSERVDGFNAGGDDYIIKPFSLEELGARVAAHIRRDQRAAIRSRMKFEDGLVIDYSGKAIYYKEEPLNLAKKEYEIITFLAQNSGQVFDKDRIYERLWNNDSDGDSTVVAEHIRRIRAKFAAVGCKTYIETIWGVGYKWVK